jgi:hypothetical protein
MRLGVPKPGLYETDIPDFLDLEDAILAGEVDIRKAIPKTDWRSELAAADGQWLAWWDLLESGKLIAGLGLIAHVPDEDEVRKGGFVSVRPFSRGRTQIPLATIVGTLDISMNDRAIWSSVDGASISSAADRLRSGQWNLIRPADDGSPITVFTPARWRRRPEPKELEAS